MRYAEVFEPDGQTPLTGGRLYAARGEHRLFFTEADRASVWKKELPELNWREVDGFETLDRQSVAWVLSFVSLSDADEEPFAYRQPTPAAWQRWLGALCKAIVPLHCKQLSTWLSAARCKLLTAPDAVRDELQLHAADLEDGEGARPAAPAGGALSPSPAKVLELLTWGDLAHRRTRGLELAGTLLYYGGSLRRKADRGCNSAIAAALVAVRQAAADRGILSMALTEPAEDQCVGVVDFLSITAWPPELVIFERSATRRRACLKLRLQGGAGGKDASRSFALSLRLLEAIAHFPSVMRLCEGPSGNIELTDAELLDVLGAATLKLAPSSEHFTGLSGGFLKLADLRGLEHALSVHSALLATTTARDLSPSERLAKLVVRRQHTALATGRATDGARGLDGDAGDSGSSSRDVSKNRGVPPHFKEQLDRALDSPNYLGVKADLLALRSSGASEALELDTLYVATTGCAPPVKDATGAVVPAAAPARDRRSTLMLLYCTKALLPEQVDPDLYFLAKCVRKEWPKLIARQLMRAEWPRDRFIPPRLLHAECPTLAKVLLSGGDWAKLNIPAAVHHLRRLRTGASSSEDAYAALPPFGAYGQFQTFRPHLNSILSLVGYPQSDHEEGWSAALAFADAVWRSGSGYHAGATRRTEIAVDSFMRAILTDAAGEVASLRATRNPEAPLPEPALAAGAWRELQAVEDTLDDIPNVLDVASYGHTGGGGSSAYSPAPHPAPSPAPAPAPASAPPSPGISRREKRKPPPHTGGDVPPVMWDNLNKGFWVLNARENSRFFCPAANFNAEVTRTGGDPREHCAQHLLGMSFNGVSACRAPPRCKRSHKVLEGFLPRQCRAGIDPEQPVAPRAKRGGRARPDDDDRARAAVVLSLIHI